jgi:hypothetical protein
MRASTYENILAELQSMSAPADFKRLAVDVIRRNAASDGFKVVERFDRKAFARHLLDEGVERSVICHRLMSLYNITESSAYRDIHDALQTVPNSGDFWDRGDV